MSSPLAFKVVIPARFASTRLPGKPLRAIAGRSMIARVWDRANASGADEVLVATDDERIVAEVERCGGRALMTSPDHLSGSDRLAEVVRAQRWPDDTVVVNLQGDEPCLPVELVSQVARALADSDAGIATLATPIRDPDELFSASAVKVVCDEQNRALYFSRAPIPWVRSSFAWGEIPAELPADVVFLRHIGMYAYRAGALLQIADHAPAASETAESLEQLRALAMGIAIQVEPIEEAPPPGVDTEADLVAASEFFSE